MLKRQTEGSVVCPGCGKLVGVNDRECWSCGRPYPGMWGFAGVLRGLGQDLGFGKIVLFGCIALYLLMLAADPSGIGTGGLLSFLAPSGRATFLFGTAGYAPVLGYGRWWTLLSAGWLHGGLLHIFFNMMWARQLVPVVAHLYGAGRAVIIYTFASVLGFALTTFAALLPLQIPFLRPAGFTLGASAAILGLLGAMVHYGRRAGSSVVGQQALGYAVVLILFGFAMPGVDNWAHIGGFGGGYLMAKWLDPLKPERSDHLMIALLLLAATLLSIVASVVFGLPVIRQ